MERITSLLFESYVLGVKDLKKNEVVILTYVYTVRDVMMWRLHDIVHLGNKLHDLHRLYIWNQGIQNKAVIGRHTLTSWRDTETSSWQLYDKDP